MRAGAEKFGRSNIQAQALSNTAGLLRENGVEGQVELIAASHADLADYVREPLDAAMFNFGYLPGGDKTVTTKADSSVRAMQAAAALLAEGGLLTAVVYSGHPAGLAEAAAIEHGRPPCRRNNIKSCTTALPTSATIRRNCWP